MGKISVFSVRIFFKSILDYQKFIFIYIKGGFISYSWSYYLFYAIIFLNIITALSIYFDRTSKFSSSSSIY